MSYVIFLQDVVIARKIKFFIAFTSLINVKMNQSFLCKNESIPQEKKSFAASENVSSDA
jgi:hypothetical protein